MIYEMYLMSLSAPFALEGLVLLANLSAGFVQFQRRLFPCTPSTSRLGESWLVSRDPARPAFCSCRDPKERPDFAQSHNQIGISTTGR